ncbi:MAG: hypothetical protein HYV07_29040 [Deltaproteobacteria bacterium]|nr:hypothetical protein [Deltaproteobacteria bacterium]
MRKNSPRMTPRAVLLSTALFVGCSAPQYVAVDSEVTIAVALDPNQTPRFAELIGAGAAEVELSDGESLVLFAPELDRFSTWDGRRPSAEEWKNAGATLSSKPVPPGGCGRCLVGRVDPTTLFPGDRCPLPASTPATLQLVVGDELVEADGAVAIDVALKSLVVDWPGTCAWPRLEHLRNDPGLELDLCFATPSDHPELFNTVDITENGTLVASALGSLSSWSAPGEPEIVRFTGPGQIIGERDGAVFLHLDDEVRSREGISRVDLAVPRLESVLEIGSFSSFAARSSNELIVFRRENEEIVGSHCLRGAEWVCNPSVPSRSDPGCAALRIDHRPDSAVVHSDRFELQLSGDPALIATRAEDGTWRCDAASFRRASGAERSELRILRGIMHEDRSLFCVADAEAKGFIATASISGGRVASFVEKFELPPTHVCRSVIDSDEGHLVAMLWPYGFVELDAAGALVEVVLTPRALPGAFGALEVGVDFIGSSPNGWVAARASDGGLYRRAPRGAWEAVQTSANVTPASVVIAAGDGECSVFSGDGRFFEVRSTGECGSVEARFAVIAGVEGQAEAALRLVTGVLLIVDSGAQRRFAWVDPSNGSLTSVFGELPARGSVRGLFELSPGRVLVALEDGALFEARVELGEVRELRSLRTHVLAVDGVPGAAFVFGDGLAVRARSGPDGFVIDDFSRRFDDIPTDTPIHYFVRGAHALAPDHVLLVGDAQFTSTGKLREAYFSVQLGPESICPGSAELSFCSATTFSDRYSARGSSRIIFIGSGDRLTLVDSFELSRPGALRKELPFGVTSAADCGSFQLLGGPAERTLMIADR